MKVNNLIDTLIITPICNGLLSHFLQVQDQVYIHIIL